MYRKDIYVQEGYLCIMYIYSQEGYLCMSIVYVQEGYLCILCTGRISMNIYVQEGYLCICMYIWNSIYGLVDTSKTPCSCSAWEVATNTVKILFSQI